MSQLIKMNEEYAQWLRELSARFKCSQLKASTKVNQELLMFYWSLGKDIVELKMESRWGTGLINNLSKDLKEIFPGQQGFSPTNLGYIKRFYKLYSTIYPQAGGELVELNHSSNNYEVLFMIPWGHHKYIMDKCKGDVSKAWFYVNKTFENNWSRSSLLNWLDTDLFERHGKRLLIFMKHFLRCKVI